MRITMGKFEAEGPPGHVLAAWIVKLVCGVALVQPSRGRLERGGAREAGGAQRAGASGRGVAAVNSARHVLRASRGNPAPSKATSGAGTTTRRSGKSGRFSREFGGARVVVDAGGGGNVVLDLLRAAGVACEGVIWTATRVHSSSTRGGPRP